MGRNHPWPVIRGRGAGANRKIGAPEEGFLGSLNGAILRNDKACGAA
jgi:hypothetical protein